MAASIDPHALEQAADWLVRLHEQDDTPTRDACRRWIDADPEHARAWQRAERLLGLVRRVPAELALPALGAPRSPGRRAALRQLGALLGVLPAGWLVWQLWGHASWDTRETSAPGQRRQLRLADGGTVELDGGTALDIAYGDSQRLLRLRHGQILVETAPDTQQPARPLRVATEHGRMQALGTRFNVRTTRAGTHLAVLEGAVLIEPDGRPAAARRIEAGQQVWFDREGVHAPHDLDPTVIAWRHGMLATDAMPLADLLQRLGEQHRGVIHCDPAIARLPVSGAWPLHDPERSLVMLEATYPVRVRSRAGGAWISVVPASERSNARP